MLRHDKHNCHLLTHLLISGVGFIGLSFGLTSQILGPYFETKNASLPYTDWAFSALALYKAILLSSYLIGIVAIFIYVSLAVVLHMLYRSKLSTPYKEAMSDKSHLVFIFGVNCCLLASAVLAQTPYVIALIFFTWIVFLILPARIFTLITRCVSIYLSICKKGNILFYVLLAVAGLVLCLAISPFLKLSDLQVSNDYLWVPEKTHLKNQDVDNRQFIISHGVGGLYQEKWLEASQGQDLAKFHHIRVPSANHLDKLSHLDKYYYEYVAPLGELFIKKSRITSEDKERLCEYADIGNCELLNQFDGVSDASLPISAKTTEFIKKNSYELKGQILAGHYFHHQYAMLGPVNELMLGKNPSSIIYLYGLGNAHLLAFSFKHIWKQYTFEHFTFTLYSFYLLYFLLYAICCFTVLRDIRYVAIAFGFGIGLTLMVGYELIRIAPGFNPVRHFLDVLLILSFCGYLNARRFNAWYLITSFVLGLLAIYASKEFGLMMFFSLMATTVTYVIFVTKRYRELGIILLASAGFVVVHHYEAASVGLNPVSLYAMLGVSVAPSNRAVAALLLMIVFVTYCCLFFVYSCRGSKYKPLYMCLFLFFYCQCLWAYFAWYTEPGHLFSTSAIWVLFFVLLSKELSSLVIADVYYERVVVSLIAGFTAVVLLLGSLKYFYHEHGYKNIFKNHIVYQWNFPNAHFKSTMDPSVFQESVALIKAYSTTNAIYIISKYDNFLPYLAGKYSAMPYLELATALVTDYEVNHAAQSILKEQPKYLFVDSDINSTNLGDILDPVSKLKKILDPESLSMGRVRVLNESKRVFKKVASQYRLIKSGYLVSVYEHI